MHYICLQKPHFFILYRHPGSSTRFDRFRIKSRDLLNICHTIFVAKVRGATNDVLVELVCVLITRCLSKAWVFDTRNKHAN